jgi:hypothetical protein
VLPKNYENHNDLKPYDDLLKEKRQAMKQLKLDIFLKNPVQQNSDEHPPSTAVAM